MISNDFKYCYEIYFVKKIFNFLIILIIEYIYNI